MTGATDNSTPDVPFSIVMPNYNQGAFLAESLAAVHSQSAPATEVIFIDDGSTDNSLDLLKRDCPAGLPLRLLRHARNQGALPAIEHGVQALTTPWFFALAPDDPVQPGMFKEAAALAAAYPHTGLCFGDYERLMPNGSCVRVRHYLSDTPCYLSPTEFAARIRRQSRFSIATANALWRREPFLAAGGVVADLHWNFDWFVAYVVAFRHGLCYLPRVQQRLRINPGSYSLAGQRRRLEQRDILRHMLRHLNSEAYADVRAFFRLPPVLARFGWDILAVLRQSPDFRDYGSMGLTLLAWRAELQNRWRARQAQCQFARNTTGG